MTGAGARFDSLRLSSPEMRRLGLLLLAAIFIAYQPVWQAGFIWDDNEHVTKPELRSLAGLARIWTQLEATEQSEG